jgi:hypothetical protein
MSIIVVLATEHPERDVWVDEQASAEASLSDDTPGAYHGVHIAPSGAPLHVFGQADEVRALIHWWAELTSETAP